MNRAVILLGLCLALAASGCWRPYYGQTYAQPVYSQAPAYQQAAPVYQQPATVIQQAPAVQGCPPVYCPPNPCCY